MTKAPSLQIWSTSAALSAVDQRHNSTTAAEWAKAVAATDP